MATRRGRSRRATTVRFTGWVVLAALALSTVGIVAPAKGIEHDAAVGTGSGASAPAGVPGTITTPPALRETDVAFLGGGPANGTRPITVTAAGNGVGVRLTSWIAGPDGQAPIRLKDSTEVLDGDGVKLHVLAADQAKATPQLLLTATVSGGALELTTWRVSDDGTFTRLSAKTYGGVAGAFPVMVEAVAVAHRTIATTPTPGTAPTVTDFIVVTPVTGRRPGDPPPDVLTLIAWRVSPAGGITKLKASGLFGASNAEPALDVVYQQAQDRFAIGYRNPSGQLVHHYWGVSDTGFLTDGGATESGWSIDGVPDPDTMTNVVTEVAQDLAMAPLGREGFISALRPQLTTHPEVVTWESRCTGSSCTLRPFRMARDDDDINTGLGVALGGVPSLTDSVEQAWRAAHGSGHLWGTSRGVTAISKGDVDGDGIEELALGRDAGSGMRYEVLRFDTNAQKWVFVLEEGGKDWPISVGVPALAMGDVDGDVDGDDELAVGRNTGDGMRYEVYDYEGGKWSRILKDGGKGWGKTRRVTALAMGDVDGDGDAELAVGRDAGSGMRYEVHDYEAGKWSTILKDGAEGWGKKRAVTAMAMGDGDGDGDDELVVGRNQGENHRFEVVDYVAGAWTYDDYGQAWDEDRGVTALAMGNLYGDGRAEIAVGRNPGAGFRYQVLYHDIVWKVLPQRGEDWHESRGVTALAIGDGDGDGLGELAAGRNAGPGMRFEAVEYNAGTDTWDEKISGAGADLLDDQAVSALSFPNVDADTNAEFVFGLNRGPGVRYRLWDWGIPRKVRGLVSDALLEANLGEGNGRLYRKVPVDELAVAQNASVGKFLTLLLAVEAIESSQSLRDNLEVATVGISKHAAENPGSHMGPEPCGEADCLEAGDTMPLNLLLYAMMNRSDNRAAVAIAEHLAESEQAFVEDVAERANKIFAELNVPTRFDETCVAGVHTDPHSDPVSDYTSKSGLACFTNPAGSSLTTLQDLVSLWRYASQKYERFATIANSPTVPDSLNLCGTDADEKEKCFESVATDKHGVSLLHPGQGGWKGGAGGHLPGFGTAMCTSCLISEATRLGRTMVVALQQTGDLWGDNNRLLNWAFRRQFAPDLRAGEHVPDLVRDFGADAMSEESAVTAAVTAADRLRVCTWSAKVEVGTLGHGSCTDGDAPELPYGAPVAARPTTVDLALLSTARAEGDYVVGHLVPEDGMPGLFRLDLTGWRVGPKFG